MQSAMRNEEIEARARLLLAAADGERAIGEAREASPSVPDAYRIAARIADLRMARGERPVGWKIGFTNRSIWDEYDVHAPIWGPMWDGSVAPIGDGRLSLAGLSEPRLEPEIAVRFARAPEPGMDARALASCLDGIAHGFEIVQSVYPAWRFTAAETVAAQALHARFRHGPFLAVGEADAEMLAGRLAAVEIVLSRDGVEVDRGTGSAVLDGPLEALRHFVDGLAESGHPLPIRAGDVVTTGTVTRAFPVASGEEWSTRVSGIPLAGLTIRFE